MRTAVALVTVIALTAIAIEIEIGIEKGTEEGTGTGIGTTGGKGETGIEVVEGAQGVGTEIGIETAGREGIGTDGRRRLAARITGMCLLLLLVLMYMEEGYTGAEERGLDLRTETAEGVGVGRQGVGRGGDRARENDAD